MGLPLYLALTPQEISILDALPSHLAYMACHFSSHSTGLSNIPQHLPAGSMLILNDSTPLSGHNPNIIAKQLSQASKSLQCSCILLDFQRPSTSLAWQVIDAILSAASCPVAVSEEYASQKNCGVFLSPPPLDISLSQHLKPWKNWEIWLEVAPEARIVTLDKSGSQQFPVVPCEPAMLPHCSQALHCHYSILPETDRVQFTLQRTGADWKALLQEAESLGVTGAVGLYQELEFLF